MALLADLDGLQVEARAEDFRFVDRLVDEWATGANRFARKGEVLLAAQVEGDLAGIGGLTLGAALTGALRMRQFYVRPAYRRLAIGCGLVEVLLARLCPFSTMLMSMLIRRSPRLSEGARLLSRTGRRLIPPASQTV